MFFTLDLKSGYHHVSHLGLSWMVKGEQEFFLLTVLPFGLATTCAMFLQICSSNLSHGFRAIVFVDDAICVANSLKEC
jgi:hypothetical protein